VFIYDEKGGKAEVTVARRGLAAVEGGERFLVLEDGHRYVGVPGEGAFQLLEFERLRMSVPDPDATPVRRNLDGLPMAELWAQRQQAPFRAEIEWRIALPVSVLMLALAVLPLGLMPPRSGRFARVPVAILVYVAYANFLILGKSWLADGITPTWLGLWWVHLIPLAAWGWFSWRQALSKDLGHRIRMRFA
jgi:lipopolysaccharide export system permease protein